MVTLLQLNKLELHEMISQELSENPVLEEGLATEEDELTAQEIQSLIEKERVADPADQGLLDALRGKCIQAMPGRRRGGRHVTLQFDERCRRRRCRQRASGRRCPRIWRRERIAEGNRPLRRDRLRRVFQRLSRSGISHLSARAIRGPDV
ncbi:MAG: hypothetical protein U5J83_13835 [Bryobacterales bacterium]|nr:hypothetical protein [Bryobacterales bacterium]